jgi:hypothetical protein
MSLARIVAEQRAKASTQRRRSILLQRHSAASSFQIQRAILAGMFHRSVIMLSPLGKRRIDPAGAFGDGKGQDLRRSVKPCANRDQSMNIGQGENDDWMV